ncbi:MAG: hypothetical protein ACRCXA_09015 [Peptostreptococcaceae bacterium]
MWDNPNEVYTIMRNTTVEYANTLIEEGAIKFNTPHSWVEYGRKYGKGRGDVFEGTFAACHQTNIEDFNKYNRMYDDVETEVRGQMVYFRRKRTMNLPCYCFYLVKTSSFGLPKGGGIQKIFGEIDSKYFKDFVDHKSIEDIEKMEIKERPSLVVVNNPKKFIGMVVKALTSLGIKESEIMVEIAEYQDKYTEHHCKAESPKELKIKPKEFKHQQEGRIIINTDNDEIKRFLSENIIKIGSIKDISKKSDTYFIDGIKIEMTANIVELE